VDSGDSAPFDPPSFFAPVAETTVNESCTRTTWDVTPIVQAWCAAPDTNFGIRLDGRGPVDNDVNFFSMEALPGRRPTLTIHYAALETSTGTASAVAPAK